MNYKTLVALVLVAAFLTEAASAARIRRRHGPSGSFHGTITSIAGNSIQIKTAQDEDKSVSLWADDKTTITAGDKQAKLADLKTGLAVTVKASNGHADTITVDTGDNSGKEKKKDKKKNKGDEDSKPKDSSNTGDSK
jgi:hypothetical protein